MSFWCLFLDPHLTTHHSNMGVHLRQVTQASLPFDKVASAYLKASSLAQKPLSVLWTADVASHTGRTALWRKVLRVRPVGGQGWVGDCSMGLLADESSNQNARGTLLCTTWAFWPYMQISWSLWSTELSRLENMYWFDISKTLFFERLLLTFLGLSR